MTKQLSDSAVRYMACLGGALLLCTQIATAQDPYPIENELPMDDITERSVVAERQILAYAPIREADLLWEKRIWRVVDVREKMNHSFAAPESPLFSIMSNAAIQGELPVYSTEDDRFSKRLSPEAVRAMLYKRDTILVWDPETDQEIIKVVENETNWEEVKRFRIKESWFFDTRTSTLRHRILGIAPLLDIRDNEGNFRYEQPFFWVYYPSSRPLLGKHKAITHGENRAETTTWEDIFERRQFASFITKENNVQDLRLQDLYSGLDVLMQSEGIKNELFAREHDMWSW